MTKIDLDTFLNVLNKESSQLTLTHYIHVNDQFETFLNIFSKVVDKHGSMRKSSRKEKRLHAKPLLTRRLLKSIQRKKLFSINYTKITMRICSKIKKSYRNTLNRTIKAPKKKKKTTKRGCRKQK